MRQQDAWALDNWDGGCVLAGWPCTAPQQVLPFVGAAPKTIVKAPPPGGARKQPANPPVTALPLRETGSRESARFENTVFVATIGVVPRLNGRRGQSGQAAPGRYKPWGLQLPRSAFAIGKLKQGPPTPGSGWTRLAPELGGHRVLSKKDARGRSASPALSEGWRECRGRWGPGSSV